MGCIVPDEVAALRLRLASLLRSAVPSITTDCMGQTNFDALNAERLRGYLAVLFIVEFTAESAGDPLARVGRLHRQLPKVPIVVFGRNGNERVAAASIKAGALDYWPIHSVAIDDLRRTLEPLFQHSGPAHAAAATPGRAGSLPVIAGYRLLKTLAQSRTAGIFLAQHSEIDRPVALKVQALGGSRPPSESERQRFRSECSLLSTLNHRALAAAFASGSTIRSARPTRWTMLSNWGRRCRSCTRRASFTAT
jgi:hypothetical protein